MLMRRIGLAVILAVCVFTVLPDAWAQRSGSIARAALFHVGLDHDPPGLAPLREGLKRLGYEEGHTIRLDDRNQADENAAQKTARAFVGGSRPAGAWCGAAGPAPAAGRGRADPTISSAAPGAG